MDDYMAIILNFVGNSTTSLPPLPQKLQPTFISLMRTLTGSYSITKSTAASLLSKQPFYARCVVLHLTPPLPASFPG